MSNTGRRGQPHRSDTEDAAVEATKELVENLAHEPALAVSVIEAMEESERNSVDVYDDDPANADAGR